MDEQTTPQPEYDIASDGAVYSGYEEERLPPAPEAPEAEPEISADGVKVSDGELKFGEEFFGDLKDSSEESSEPPAPNWYTDDELQQIPFEH